MPRVLLNSLHSIGLPGAALFRQCLKVEREKREVEGEERRPATAGNMRTQMAFWKRAVDEVTKTPGFRFHLSPYLFPPSLLWPESAGRRVSFENARPSEGFLSLVLLRNPFALLNGSITFGPFNCNVQKRWKKPIDSAQTRLENRTRDPQLDKLLKLLNKLNLVLRLHGLMSQSKVHTSVQLLSRWRKVVGLNVGIGYFIQKHPHIFELYKHPVRRNICCKISEKMSGLVAKEALVIRESEQVTVQQLKKLLMLSNNGRLHAHALWLVRREFGLPDDFRDLIVRKYFEDFRFVHPDTIELVRKDGNLPMAEIEKWREIEYGEKWLSEYETRYAFPIQFPTGFKIDKGFREKLKNWQRLPYVKAYNKMGSISARTYGVESFEKHAVGILHEFLSLTVEKMIDVEKLSHFRREFNMEVNLRELILKHPGVFYIATKGNTLAVFLRGKYSKGCLLEPNPLQIVRRKMMDVLLL